MLEALIPTPVLKLDPETPIPPADEALPRTPQPVLPLVDPLTPAPEIALPSTAEEVFPTWDKIPVIAAPVPVLVFVIRKQPFAVPQFAELLSGNAMAIACPAIATK